MSRVLLAGGPVISFDGRPSTAQIWPFPAHGRWPRHIGDRAMDTYHRWMKCTLFATFAGLPAISVPVGYERAAMTVLLDSAGARVRERREMSAR